MDDVISIEIVVLGRLTDLKRRHAELQIVVSSPAVGLALGGERAGVLVTGGYAGEQLVGAHGRRLAAAGSGTIADLSDVIGAPAVRMVVGRQTARERPARRQLAEGETAGDRAWSRSARRVAAGACLAIVVCAPAIGGDREHCELRCLRHAHRFARVRGRGDLADRLAPTIRASARRDGTGGISTGGDARDDEWNVDPGFDCDR